MTLTPQTLPDAESYNVIADWKGTEHPEQVVIVSGHLDSWDLGTGAIDDGAGVVVSMQVIHLLKELGIHPRRTVRVIAWMSEEEGSRRRGGIHDDHTDGDGEHMWERSRATWARTIRREFTTRASRRWGSGCGRCRRCWTRLAPRRTVAAPETGEDIDGLTEKGVPSFAPVQDSRFYFNYHHTAADTFDKVDQKHLGENAAVMTVLAYALADSAEAAAR